MCYYKQGLSGIPGAPGESGDPGFPVSIVCLECFNREMHGMYVFRVIAHTFVSLIVVRREFQSSYILFYEFL